MIFEQLVSCNRNGHRTFPGLDDFWGERGGSEPRPFVAPLGLLRINGTAREFQLRCDLRRTDGHPARQNRGMASDNLT